MHDAHVDDEEGGEEDAAHEVDEGGVEGFQNLQRITDEFARGEDDAAAILNKQKQLFSNQNCGFLAVSGRGYLELCVFRRVGSFPESSVYCRRCSIDLTGEWSGSHDVLFRCPIVFASFWALGVVYRCGHSSQPCDQTGASYSDRKKHRRQQRPGSL